MKPFRTVMAGLVLLLLGLEIARATPTENLGMRVLPAPGKVVVDGKSDDWDLSGGVFACNDVEAQREQYSVWLHSMYDADNLYFFAHFLDPSPLNNPGQVGADYGFAGDCLQVRFISRMGTPQEQIINVTAWRGRGEKDAIDMDYVGKNAPAHIADAKTQGGQQAFAVDADGKGYTQEMAIPWKLLTKDGQPLHPGDTFKLSFEPNFTVGKSGRLTVKDVFQPGVTVDRVFTFRAYKTWGDAKLETKGHQDPRPVRLADTREFPVKLENQSLVVNWTGLISEKVLPGFKSVRFTMPEDGFASLNIKDASGKVVCQLLRGFQFSKGEHEVKWDGLATPNGNVPGEPVPAGEYTWSGLFHKDISLKLRGWADNAGNAPWDNGPTTNWGGDEGNPTYCATADGQMFLAWGFAEAGRSLLATDLQGNVRWKNNRAGMAGVKAMGTDAGVVYVMGGSAGGPSAGGNLYTLDAKTGDYIMGADGTPDINVKALWPDATGKSDKADGIAVRNDRIYLSFTQNDTIMVVDAKTRKLIRTLQVPAPGTLSVGGPDSAAGQEMIYVLSGGTKVLGLKVADGSVSKLVEGLSNAVAMTVDRQGRIYVGEREPDQQIKIFDNTGKPVGTIGRKGGRPLLGPWVADGFAFINGIALDGDGKLWVAENDAFPKRVTAWNVASGQLIKEFFGPTHYGASGGAISPLDPNVMAGEGCEWKLDPKTGRAVCTGVFERSEANFARFCVANKKLYLATLRPAAHGSPVSILSIYERIGQGDYKLRSTVTADAKGKTTKFWADENGDGVEQPDEVTTLPEALALGGYYHWSMNVSPDLTLTANMEVKVKDFTRCGAPKYDVSHASTLPEPGVASMDGQRLLTATRVANVPHTTFDCYDLKSGALVWSFPSVYGGVHGSHNAPPPEPGLIRGAFGIVGTGKLPEPIGDVWAINSNVSEWHLLTRDGFYLTRLFEPDFLKYEYPDPAEPGADVSKTPPGMGGEDFGGSMTQGVDGKLYIQSGKVALWDLEVSGLESARAIPGGTLTISESDVKLALAQHDGQLQAVVGTKEIKVKSLSPKFTGSLDADFKGADIVTYQKADDTRTRSAATFDAKNLYLAWEVKDATPWQNGADAPEFMYVGGDTVDFQVGTEANANPKRNEAVLGDLRLSIGNFKGAPTAVIYRKVAAEKHPKTFSSGVVKDYEVDSVVVAGDVSIKVTKRTGGYVVEASVPLATLGLHPASGLKLRGDFGVTFGDPAGQRTRLRNHWSNQHTGLVDDAVFELMMEPKNWGELVFE
jgi:sugar lactone lactonase YvrE